MRYTSVFYDIQTIRDLYHYVHFKSDITQTYHSLEEIYTILRQRGDHKPILYDISKINGMDFEAMDFTLEEWHDITDVRFAFVSAKGTISEKYAATIQKTHPVRETLRFFENPLEAVHWLLQPTKT